MLPFLAVTVGLLVQSAGNPHHARATRAPAPDPVRVWRTDSTVYVALRQPGHLLVLHVDAIGRIQVVFPLAPDDSTAMSDDAPVALALPPTGEGNPATFVAVRSRWPFEFAALRAGASWNYYDALLLQPTAGDPLGALLDIADRVTDGRPYDYAEVTYSRAGTVVARGPVVPPQVCLSCVRRAPPAVAVAAAPTHSVDCSNAALTNSFCGVNSGSVSITSMPAPQAAYQPPPAPQPVYIPYYLPIVVHGARRFPDREFPPPAPPAPRSMGVAFPMAPRLVVPSRGELQTFTGRRH